MCLITDQIKPIILEEDMIVYKLARIEEDKITSPFEQFEWELGVLYTQSLSFVNSFLPTYAERVKQLSPIPVVFDARMYCFTPFDESACVAYEDKLAIISVAEGFHFSNSKERLLNSITYLIDGVEVMECLIPKESLVYFDETNLGVSNQIIMKNKCVY